MQWALAIVAVTLLAVAAISRRLYGTPITPAMVFVAVGLLAGPQVLDGIDVETTSSTVRALAEATLALVLFCDASRIDLGELRREVGVPVRLLGIGLPLTIALGMLAAAVLFDQLAVEEALILAIILAPTDAALGQAVVTEPRIPGRIRQGLNVESGLNDGICVPQRPGAPSQARRDAEHERIVIASTPNPIPINVHYASWMSPPATLVMWFQLRSPELAEDFERLMTEDREIVLGSLDAISDWRLTRPADVPGQSIGQADYVLIAEIVEVERFEQQASEHVQRLEDDLAHLVSSRGMLVVRPVL